MNSNKRKEDITCCPSLTKKLKVKNDFLCATVNPLEISVNQCLRHNLGYKQKIIQFIRRNQVYFSSSNVSTDTTVIVKDYMLSEKFTQSLLFTQHIVLDNDCCISRNVGRTEINLVTSNKLYYLLKYQPDHQLGPVITTFYQKSPCFQGLCLKKGRVLLGNSRKHAQC